MNKIKLLLFTAIFLIINKGQAQVDSTKNWNYTWREHISD